MTEVEKNVEKVLDHFTDEQLAKLDNENLAIITLILKDSFKPLHAAGKLN